MCCAVPPRAQLRLLTLHVMADVVGGFDFSRDELLDLATHQDTLVKGLFVLVPINLPFTREHYCRPAAVAWGRGPPKIGWALDGFPFLPR